VLVSRSREPLERLGNAHSGRVKIVPGDLGNLSLRLGKKAVDVAISAWGRLDGLVVNHGRLNPVQRVSMADPVQWRETFDVNLFSAVEIVR
jgi:NAD(P)-dependent dehydrogenase (short-subunit alcohol dehydrogenase family)